MLMEKWPFLHFFQLHSSHFHLPSSPASIFQLFFFPLASCLTSFFHLPLFHQCLSQPLFPTYLFHQPHFSPTSTRSRLEEWLRVMLEWDPAVRGQVQEGGNKQVVAFSMINEILNKKVVTQLNSVFSAIWRDGAVYHYLNLYLFLSVMSIWCL